MVYQIYIGDEGYRHVLFDIEFYQKKVGWITDENMWYSEIHVLPIVDGIWKFFETVKDNKDFNSQEFLEDAENIQELRRWLYEVDGNKNSKDSKLHYERNAYIKKVIYDFADKYRLYVNVD